MDGADTADLTIIGIGSSAGGLEAIRELVATLPTDLQVAYVVVQHMSPHHKSLMTELVARQTSLAVRDVKDGCRPEPNVIYVTPPKTDVVYDAGKLCLVDPSHEVATPKPSVDRFLSSLADEHGEKSMAIILSGTGTDGAYGVQAIREAGGITIAQDTESAKYDGMPMAAMQTGCVDLVLRPFEIGTHLQKILTSPRDFDAFRQETSEQGPSSDLLQILLARTRVDFREYKQTTINRRIERRMIALGIDSHEEYTQFCRVNPNAVDALFKDLLISVTRFFRDKNEFQTLRELLPSLLNKQSTAPFRVWIAGCATGEEAYSIAILLSEALGGAKVNLKDHVQIFATDIDKDALEVARKGVYGMAALNDIPRDLADRYFIQQNDGIRVIDSLRSAILFSDHNVCQDPPFQKVDLLCCRNLLIYFGNALQHKVMSRFHYALTDNSLMFLGTAETVAGSDELFIQDSQSAHIYRRRSIRRSEQTPFANPRNLPQSRRIPAPSSGSPAGDSTDRQMFEALALALGKNSVLVTNEYSIVRIYGNVSSYIEMTETSNLKMHIDLLRRPFREEARSLVTLALKNAEHRSGVRHLLAEDDDAEIRLDVYPIIARDLNERAALVVFSEVQVDRARAFERQDTTGEDAFETDRIRLLEDEVATTREALQQTIEELETSNEELQSLNEELQSTNEELQATNEELETSNEELQSTNEELITVNEELQVTAAELSGRTGELMSVLETAPLAIMVLDTALQITQATNAAAELFNLSRPIAHPHVSQCVLPENCPALAPICNETLKLGEPISREFTSKGGRFTLMCSPFFDMRGQMKGSTMVISQFPGLAQELDMILDHAEIFMLNRATDGTILRISQKSADLLGTTRREAEGQNFYKLASKQVANAVKERDKLLMENTSGRLQHVNAVVEQQSGQKRWMSSENFIFADPSQKESSIYSVGTDITDVVMARDKAEDALEQLTLLQNLAHVGFWAIDLNDRSVYWSSEVYRIHGEDPDGPPPDLSKGLDYYHPEDRAAVEKEVARVMEKGGDFHFIRRIITRQGEAVKVESFGLARADQDGEIKRIIGVFRAMPED
ncbi:Protein-glutamate methylesterase/protein-glutamine glutaminase [Roseobacter fucihabitans]|uniref:protein-glutamate O-methyltransferase n=1 Tax=Roseobacter fucihabitans TaxID=1537242 RepID=A0ABZ2BUN3_9RHOB|nr:chemotaxis protein CheB [Roseobacter litoralis]MBC6966179.1 Chemotaxis protein methyltransferase [Roseobacter litoralis]